MSVMSNIEARFCRSAPWRGFARRVVLPWAITHAVVGPKVLEIGGGSGAMAYELLKREPDVQLTMADVDPAMVTAARARLKEFEGRATAVQGDATSLDLPDNSFDTVCSWLMLHHTIDWSKVLAEAARLLRPGGTVIGYDLTDSSVARFIHQVDRSDHRLIRPAELEAELGRNAFESNRVEPALAGLVMKFEAQTPSV
jgi:SAM-dependent methyltransferase